MRDEEINEVFRNYAKPGRDTKLLKRLAAKPGYLRPDAGDLLFYLSVSLPRDCHIVEIGAFLGKSTAYIAAGLRGKPASFITVDTFDSRAMSKDFGDTRALFEKTVAEFRERIEVWEMTSEAASQDYAEKGLGPIDLLWVDGDHSEQGVLNDCSNWLPMLAADGLVVFDDYYDLGPNKRVKTAVDRLCSDGLIQVCGTVANSVVCRPKAGLALEGTLENGVRKV